MDIRDNISTVLTTFMLTPCILHFMFFSPEHILVLGGSTHPTNQFGLMNYRSAHSSTVPCHCTMSLYLVTEPCH